MLICSSLDEVKRRESALRFIANLLKGKERSSLYDLSGLAEDFQLKRVTSPCWKPTLGSYFFNSPPGRGKKHLGGDKVAAFNRTSAAILATILALVKPGEEVLHYLPELPSHPSIPAVLNFREQPIVKLTTSMNSNSLLKHLW
jgi:L-seryl-tRNA(Ser) seleniumtransferase